MGSSVTRTAGEDGSFTYHLSTVPAEPPVVTIYSDPARTAVAVAPAATTPTANPAVFTAGYPATLAAGTWYLSFSTVVQAGQPPTVDADDTLVLVAVSGSVGGTLVSLDEVKAHLNKSGATTVDDAELLLFVAAAEAHVSEHWGLAAAGVYTEEAYTDHDGRLLLSRNDVTSVSSAVNEWGTAVTSEFTIAAGGFRVSHPSFGRSQRWTVTYAAGPPDVPADLKLAVLLDIQGLWQPSQLGPPAALGAFGLDAADVQIARRPLNMWPRVDAWFAARRGPVVA